ncbi:MAG: ATP-dependent zinc metalloprotease FtsH [Eubacteriales bacterium]
MKINVKAIILYAVLIFAIIFTVMWMSGGNEANKLTYSEMLEKITSGEVSEFTLSNKNVLTIKTADGTYSKTLRDAGLFFEHIDDYLKEQDALPESERALKKYEIQEPRDEGMSIFLSFLPTVILIIVAIALFFFMTNRLNGGTKINSFGKAKAKCGTDEKSRVYFSDVAGADEEKEELREIVEYLKDPGKFMKLGAKIPHGVLLVGPPGTGKTLLAKAVAGEAGVPFFSISGSDFVEMYVGVGASRVRDLFDTARKASSAIIFIDEIDAVGRRRGTGLGGGHDEKEQTLNQLLVEMDGFGGHSGVIVMAATNRPDILDPALLRPGRFDRQITVGYPDIRGREEILKVHSRNKPFEKEVDLAKIAQLTVGFTGADLANLLNEAALLAARKSKTLIGMNDISEAYLKITTGTQKKNLKIKPEEKRKTAYHEAGHAILAHLLPTQDPVRQISIIPSGNALGFTLNVPEEDKFSVYKQELKEQIAMLLGGRAAEEIVFSDISGGASNDILRATQIARKMVTKLGMSDAIGNVHFGSDNSSDEVFLGRDFSAERDYSDETASLIDREVKRLIDEAYTNAKKILSENRERLDFIADFLVKHEMMDDVQFKAYMDDNASEEEIIKLSEEKQRKSAEENKKREEAEAEARRRDEEERLRREREAREKESHEKKNDYPDNPFFNGQ